jgi:chemotaxis response regulator CheB
MVSLSLPLTGAVANGSGVIGIVGSAGGISALIELLSLLPADFPFPVIVAQHLAPCGPSILPEVLMQRGRLSVKWAENGESPRASTVYIIPAGYDLDVGADGFAISPLSPSALAWLPCPDLLLGGLARCYGARAIGIVLSGMMAVGIDGMRAIRRAGGVTMAQSEASSAHFEMPCSAIDLGKADIILSPGRLAEVLIILAEAWAEKTVAVNPYQIKRDGRDLNVPR